MRWKCVNPLTVYLRDASEQTYPTTVLRFRHGRILQNRIGDWADFLTGRRFVMAYTLGAFVAVNLINAVAH